MLHGARVIRSDLIANDQDDLSKYRYEFFLWRTRWNSYTNPLSSDLNWNYIQLLSSERQLIPDVSGIYALVLKPGIANHHFVSYLMYIGQTTSLKRRFGDYLSECSNPDRMKVFKMIRLYSNLLWFYYASVPAEQLTPVEDSLLETYIPPINSRFPTTIRHAVAAFR